MYTFNNEHLQNKEAYKREVTVTGKRSSDV